MMMAAAAAAVSLLFLFFSPATRTQVKWQDRFCLHAPSKLAHSAHWNRARQPQQARRLPA